MTENMKTVDLQSPLLKRRLNKTEREQLLREIKELDNHISPSSVHTSGKTDEILVDLSEGEHQRVQINSSDWSRIQR